MSAIKTRRRGANQIQALRLMSSGTIPPGAIVSRSMDCHTKRQLDIRRYSAWDVCQTADKELNDAKGKDKTAYTAALGECIFILWLVTR
jgi:hypothetical protein